METSCKTPTGVSVGLIDSVISICRVLAPRLRQIRDHHRWPKAIKEALMDLYQDKDVLYVLTFIGSESPYIDDEGAREIIRSMASDLIKNQTPIII